MRFSRWQALGNVYLLVERADGGGPLEAETVRRVCRDGADGVLEVLHTSTDEVEIVVWNADGSTAEISGNGTRIAARWLAERTGSRAVRVRVGGREISAEIGPDGQVEQDMGDVEVGPSETVAGIELTPVSVGNPHAVVRGDPAEITRIGPLLESHARFPGRTNVQVARIERPGEVTARVWERGVGETASSGTGAVAVAAATHDRGEVVVRFPGGDLLVRLDDGGARLVGYAEAVDAG